VKLGGPLKETCLCITVSLGPFENNVFTNYNCCRGPLWKQSSLLIHYSCCSTPLFESKVLFTLQLQRGGKCLACLPLNAPLYIILAMILYENMKQIEHVLLLPICVLSHLMCACKHCNVKLSLYYWTHWSCWCVNHFKTHISRDFSYLNLDT